MARCPDAATTLAPRAARLATSVVFALHAVIFAAWVPYIPIAKDRLGLNDGTLGLTLLGAPFGAVVAIMCVGAMTARWGSRPVVLGTVLGYGGGASLLGLADTAPWLFAALALWGGCQGAMDVAMNAQAVSVEKGYGRPVMSSFHAWWSLGGFTGTGLGVVGVALDVPMALHLGIVGGTATVLVYLASTRMLRGDHGDDVPERRGNALRTLARDKRLLVLGLLMLAALLCEGAAADWAAIYFTDSLNTTAALAGSGYGVFAVAMFAGRALGDRWVAQYGARGVVRLLAGTAAVVLTVALLIGHPVAAWFGFATLGLGLACAVPVVFSAAAALPGLHPARGIAAVSAAAWPAFLLGPPIIGGLAHATSLTLALYVLPLLCAGMAVGAAVLDEKRA
jgi:fucose permease